MSEANNRRKELSERPLRITNNGIFFGDEEFPYAVLQDSVIVKHATGKYNTLTVTIPCGEVTMEPRRSAYRNDHQGAGISGDSPYVPERR